MDFDKGFSGSRSARLFNEGNDDLYNLSVRKKAVGLCGRISQNLCALCGGGDLLTPGESVCAEYGQIDGIVSRIGRALYIKGLAQENSAPAAPAEGKNLEIKLLASVAADLSGLAVLVNIRSLEKELSMCLKIICERLNEKISAL